MRKLMLLAVGAAIGFVAAHFVNQSPGGRRFFERVNQGAEELGHAFSTGYHAAERDQLDDELDRAIDELGTRN